jgi:hypothetical protein
VLSATEQIVGTYVQLITCHLSGTLRSVTAAALNKNNWLIAGTSDFQYHKGL